jgi:hypothetical protein
MRYEDENIWLTQKMLAALYDVEVPTVNEHIKKIFTDHELQEEATIKNFRIVQSEGSRQVNRDMNESEMSKLQRLNRFIEATDREVLQDAGKVTAEIAKAHAESEFEKYRLFRTDCSRAILISS